MGSYRPVGEFLGTLLEALQCPWLAFAQEPPSRVSIWAQMRSAAILAVEVPLGEGLFRLPQHPLHVAGCPFAISVQAE